VLKATALLGVALQLVPEMVVAVASESMVACVLSLALTRRG
jgi:hypothetical protein